MTHELRESTWNMGGFLMKTDTSQLTRLGSCVFGSSPAIIVHYNVCGKCVKGGIMNDAPGGSGASSSIHPSPAPDHSREPPLPRQHIDTYCGHL